MDAPSAQLYQELRDAMTRGLSHRRPLLHHLNADTSWLLQLPRPAAAAKRGGRVYHNILIDPWLAGGQSDIAKWFSQQWHATESAVKSIAEVEALAREIEILAGGLRLGKGREKSVFGSDEDIKTFIDAVAISHEFTDHCHKETLLEVDPDVPVFATKKAAALIKSWSHFRDVQETPPFTTSNPDWRGVSLPPLPEWLSISRIIAEGDAFYYHSALLITFNIQNDASNAQASTNGTNGTSSRRTSHHLLPPGHSHSFDSSNADAAECVIYTPHGISAAALTPVSSAQPPLSTLAFLHGLHDVSISGSQQLNLGAHNGLEAQRRLNARYWVGTHDEIKKGGGLVSWFLRRKVITVEEALQKESRKAKIERVNEDAVTGRIGKGTEVEDVLADVRFENLGNGESRVLT